MKLEGIIAVTGKPGLFKVIGQTKNGVILESLDSGKRMALNSTSKMSALQDIAIYTHTNEVPLVEVFDKIRIKENGSEAISHKSSAHELLNYFKEILEDFDDERVYPSDIKKVILWYNLLQKFGPAEEITNDEEIEDATVKKPKVKSPKKTNAKKAKKS